MPKRLKAKEKKEALIKNSKFLKKLFKFRPYTIGIDLGTFTTGFSIIYKESTHYPIHGGPKNNMAERKYTVISTFTELLGRYNCNDKAIAILEDYSFGSGGGSLSELAELGGAIKHILYGSKIPYFRLAPATLKKFVLGPSKGSKKGAKKELMLVEVLDRWGIKFSDNNVCDAYCLTKFILNLRDYVNGKAKISKWKMEMFNNFIALRGEPVMKY
jgi:Holliday junction resolvasome RuvABC endonuclease subunit